MVSYHKFIRESEIYLVIVRKELGDPSISELKEIIESNKDASKILCYY
jgi:molybdate-binding protein